MKRNEKRRGSPRRFETKTREDEEGTAPPRRCRMKKRRGKPLLNTSKQKTRRGSPPRRFETKTREDEEGQPLLVVAK